MRYLCLFLALTAIALSHAHAISVQFDYTYDTDGFFSGANVARRSYLDAAAQVFTVKLSDSLTAITPSGGNTWSATFTNPTTGGSATLSNLQIQANTVVVFAGARNLGAGTLGIGGPGGWSATGTQSWFDTVDARGQTGALATTPTDFGPWGGSIAFNSTAPWYFDSNPNTLESFSGQDDFFSVAVHELGHLLGFGTAESWDTYVSGTSFIGPHATAANKGLHASLSADQAHWASNTTSTIFGTNTVQEVAMDPSLTVGTRKYFTTLDYAGLQDVGWVVIPEPSSIGLILAGLVICGFGKKRSRGAPAR